MKKYRCIICGHIYDEAKEQVKFADLPNDWTCPKCGVSKEMFEEIKDEVQEDETPSNAVKISKNNVSIKRILDKCINCGLCKMTCTKKEGMTFDQNSDLCINCGQCIQACPVKSLVPVDELELFLKAKKSGKKCIAYTSPSVRVAFGDIFNLKPGEFTENKLVGFLKQLGFDYVLDTNFAADLTIMEEASELVDRIKNNGVLPMFTSCCPAWIKYAEQFYPEVIPNISSCKSPIGMMGPIVKEYFTKLNNINDSYTVAITPCTAKKYEIRREEITGTDLVITLYELQEYIKKEHISYESIKEANFDCLNGSGAGVIFGNTGGVMEAALRTAYHLLTNKDLNDIEFIPVRGYNDVKEATITINDLTLNVAVVDGITNAKEILDDVKNGKCKYQYIEIMNCVGGCIGGGGQPKTDKEEVEIRRARINSIYNRDKEMKCRLSYKNEEINKLYNDFLKNPLSDVALNLLHTKYTNRQK